MLNIQKLYRLQYFNLNHLRKLSCIVANSYCRGYCGNSSELIFHSYPLKSNLYKEDTSRALCYSTSSLPSDAESQVDFNVFDKACEETLESLTEFFEELAECKDKFSKADISYSGGVLTVNLGKYGTYVINRQAPNKQIWLSSPVSGPKRYDYVVSGSYWIYKHDSVSLHELLQAEISKILGEKVDISNCLHSKV